MISADPESIALSVDPPDIDEFAGVVNDDTYLEDLQTDLPL